MDKIDKIIINMLQENARATISEISSKVSLSMPAISERVKKLEASGIIDKYAAIINPKYMNKNIEALIMIRFDNIKDEDGFREYAKTEIEIQECVVMTGIFNYCIKVITENTETLEALVAKIKEKGANKLDVSLVLSTVVHKPTLKLA
ncbi:transcriptional regulator [Anaerovibrio lipolyticus]|uniref:Transcriptional regulator n=1 Tax=Anaerovibrio lipolyticus TaxID=82374 RepID=A0A0B2JXJ3_9FIRM|nr:Lrp/AsnC family transcriptional regulator [Anaerovibrio lipolyticus]KHM51366.1 transcriptional regulator [Anaerovibrio lipolyticus]